MFSCNHTLFFLFTLLLHAAGILLIVRLTQPQSDNTIPELELSAVELNLTDASEDSQPSPPPPLKPELQKPEPVTEKPVTLPEPTPPPPEPVPRPEPVPEPVPDPPEPEPEPAPVITPEPEPIVLPVKEPMPQPPPAEPEPERKPAPEPPRPEVETKPHDPPENLIDQTEAVADPPPKLQHEPSPEMPESETPESGAASARIDVPPRPRRTIKPIYPAGARRRNEEGAVTLHVKISATGLAVDVEVTESSGFPELDQAARHAVQKAQFAPGKIGTQTVESSVGLTIIFKLR